VAGASMAQVNLAANGIPALNARLSPDGQTMAIGGLHVINIDGTDLQRLTYNNVFDSFPMFSPDGKKLVFASNRNPQKPRATDIFIADWVEEK